MTSTLLDIWRQRPDLQTEFPDPLKKGVSGNWTLNDWWNQNHLKEYPNTTLVEPGGTSVTSQQAISQGIAQGIAPLSLAQAVQQQKQQGQLIVPATSSISLKNLPEAVAVQQGMAQPVNTAPLAQQILPTAQPVTSPIASPYLTPPKPLINLGVSGTSVSTLAILPKKDTATKLLEEMNEPISKNTLPSFPWEKVPVIGESIAKAVEYLRPKTLAEQITSSLPIGGMKIVGELASSALKKIATLVKPQEIFSILKKEIPNIADDVATKLSETLKSITNKSEVQPIVNKALTEAKKVIQPLTQEAGKVPPIIKQGVNKKTAEAVIVPATRLEKQVGVLGGENISPVLQKAITKEIPNPKIPQAGKLPTISDLPLAKVNDLNIPLTQTYKGTVDKSIAKVAQQVKESPTIVKRVIDSLKETKTRVLEYVQNSKERVRQLVNRKDIKVTDVSDPYLKSTLYSGRVATKITLGKEEANTIIKEMKKVADDFKIDLATVRKEVNDYLQFRHAPERNVALGEKAAGITTKEAQEGLKVLETSPRGAQIKALADKAQALNNKTLETLRESGVITEDLYNTLRNKYKNHVPLQRIFEETDNIEQALSGKGFDVKTTGIIKAKGSERAVEDILSNIVANYEQAILRAEKNIVDNSTLAFVRNNKVVLGDLFEIKKPRAIGTAFDGRILLEKTSDPTILQMFEKGKPVWIKINDSRLAVALRGVGREKLGTLLNAVGTFTKLYSGLATRFNPEFALPNKIRDLQEAAVYLASQKGVGFGGAAKTVGRDVLQQNTKAIFDALRGVKSEGARLYNEMKSMGGTTGGFGLSTKTEVKMSIEQLEKLANSKTKRVANNLLKYVDYWNTIFEDSTRLSVYRQSLSQGLSKERAAFLAKEATINFNRMGTGGPVINALWMFSNASIQGSVKMIRSLKNPKVLGATVAVVGGSVAAVNQWNDKVDPEWRDKVSKWDRLNGLPIAIPTIDGGIKYVVIPVSWGIKPIKVLADYAYDAISGEKFNVGNFINDTITAIADAYNPAGGSDLVSAITPTILDVPVELARNTSWSGNKIKPDYDPNAPQDIRYFDSLTETKTGEVAISLSEALKKYSNIAVSPADIKYAYEQYTGGVGRTASKAVNTMTGFATGQPVPLDEYPFISRFYREKSEQEAGYSSEGVQEIKGLLQEQSRDRFYSDKEAKKVWETVKNLSPEEWQNWVDKTDPELLEAVKKVSEEKEIVLTPLESYVMNLGVENGERAKYIYKKIEQLGTQEEKSAYVDDLKAKKIISDTVLIQLNALENK